jgi:hypothetical protein
MCPVCGDGISSSDNHKCKPNNFSRKPLNLKSDVPEHVKKYGESIGWTSKNMNRVWY